MIIYAYIFRVDSVRCLTGLEKLISLRLQDTSKGLSNPVCMNSSYRADILRMFPNLTTLDGRIFELHCEKTCRRFWTRSNTTGAVQPQKMVGGLKFQI